MMNLEKLSEQGLRKHLNRCPMEVLRVFAINNCMTTAMKKKNGVVSLYVNAGIEDKESLINQILEANKVYNKALEDGLI
jgi:hypothetical protein